MMMKLLLILDIDETLVYSSETPLDRKEDLKVESYYTYTRPHLSGFIEYALENYLVAIWSSSSESYCDAILEEIIPDQEKLEFVWSRDRCTRKYDPEIHDYYWIKDLKKVKKKGYNLERTLIVDDSPEKISRNYGNHIKIPPFLGDPRENVLLSLQDYLSNLETADDVRTIDKRSWLINYKKKSNLGIKPTRRRL
jgi:RNA polymerase II subunit A small phosphatase-like protein